MTLYIPFTPPPSLFTTTLRGFVFFDETDQQTKSEVQNIVANTLFKSGESSETTRAVKRFLVNKRDNLPAIITNLEDAIRFLQKSVSIHCFDLVKKDIGTGEGKKQLVWNVYIFPPTKDHRALQEWKDFIQRIMFVTEPIQLLFHLWCCVIWYHNIPFGLALTLVYIGCMPQGGWATKFPYTKAVTSLYEVTRFPSGLGVTLA